MKEYVNQPTHSAQSAVGTKQRVTSGQPSKGTLWVPVKSTGLEVSGLRFQSQLSDLQAVCLNELLNLC